MINHLYFGIHDLHRDPDHVVDVIHVEDRYFLPFTIPANPDRIEDQKWKIQYHLYGSVNFNKWDANNSMIFRKQSVICRLGGNCEVKFDFIGEKVC